MSHPEDVPKKGDLLLLRITSIDASRKHQGLSSKRVLESDWGEWATRQTMDKAEKDRGRTGHGGSGTRGRGGPSARRRSRGGIGHGGMAPWLQPLKRTSA